MEYSKDKVAARIKVIRADRLMTQEKLSEKSNVPVESIKKYESAKSGMTLETAFKLAEACDCSIDEIACRKQFVCSS